MFLYLIQIFNTKMLTQYEDINFYYLIFISTPTLRPGDGLSRFSRGIWRFTLIACGPEWLSSTGVCNSYCISRAVAYAWCPSALRIRRVELAFAQTLRPLSLAGPSMAFEIYLNCTFQNRQFSIDDGLDYQMPATQLKRAREMEICMQQIGCFQDFTLYLLITCLWMVRFEPFLACRWVLIIRTKSQLYFYKIFKF